MLPGIAALWNRNSAGYYRERKSRATSSLELANRETKLINKRQKPRIASRNTHKPIAAPIKQIFKKAIDQA